MISLAKNGVLVVGGSTITLQTASASTTPSPNVAGAITAGFGSGPSVSSSGSSATTSAGSGVGDEAGVSKSGAEERGGLVGCWVVIWSIGWTVWLVAGQGVEVLRR